MSGTQTYDRVISYTLLNNLSSRFQVILLCLNFQRVFWAKFHFFIPDNWVRVQLLCDCFMFKMDATVRF